MKKQDISTSKDRTAIDKLAKKIDLLSYAFEQSNNNTALSFEGWVNNQQFINHFGICSKTAYNWRTCGLRFYIRNRRIFYHSTDIELFLKQNTVN